MRGTVTEFDEHRGLGTVTAPDGRRYPFHCTQVADGSRAIATGSPVRFVVRGRLGGYEAAALEPAP